MITRERKSKAQRKARRQEVVSNIRTFIDKHDDEVLPVVRAVTRVAAPRVQNVIDAIREVRDSKMQKESKAITIDHLSELADLVDDAQIDPSQLMNSTLISKWTSPFINVMVAIICFGAYATNIAHYWGWLPNAVPDKEMMAITGMFTALNIARTWGRSEVKKQIIQNTQP